MPHVPSPLTPQEVAALRAILAARGRHDEPAAPEGLTILGRARDIVPSAVDRDDDSLLFMTPEGAIVVGAVRDDGSVTYMRLDLDNNLHVIDAAGGSILVNIIGAMQMQTSNLAALQTTAESILELVNTRVNRNDPAYLWESFLQAQALGYRKVLRTDVGDYVAPAAGGTQFDYTGVNLANLTCGLVWNRTDRTLHRITNVTNPVPPAAGVITLETPIATAAAVLLVPYLSAPHAYSTPTDAMRTEPVTASPPRLNGPAVLLNATGAAAQWPNVTTQYTFFTANYGRCGLQIEWSTVGGTRTFVFNTFGIIDDGALPGAGAWPAAFNINTWWQITAGSTALGAAAAANGATVARMADPHPFHRICVEMTVALTDANNSTVEMWHDLYGGNR